MADICEVIITASDTDWLAEFTRSLIEGRLAACGHLLREIRSIYRWEGEVHDERESRVALHTRSALVSAINERTNREHPYDVPCVIALPIVDANPAYVDWVLAETAEAAGP